MIGQINKYVCVYVCLCFSGYSEREREREKYKEMMIDESVSSKLLSRCSRSDSMIPVSDTQL